MDAPRINDVERGRRAPVGGSRQMVGQQPRGLIEPRFSALTGHLPHWVIVKNAALTYQSCNETFARDLGRRPEDLIGKCDGDVFPAAVADRSRADDERVMREGRAIVIEEPNPRYGRHGWVQTIKTPVFDDAGALSGLMVVYQDITERRRETDELKRRGWALAALNRAHQALLHAESERALLHGVCAAVTLDNMYPLVWIGWAEDGPRRAVRVDAAAGKAIGYIEGLMVSWGEGPFGDGPVGRALRRGATTVDNDVAVSASFAPWLHRAERFGLHGLICVPLQTHFGQGEQSIPGVLVVYAAATDAFGPDEIALFEELAGSLAPGVENRRMRIAYDTTLKAHAAHERQLRQAMEDALTVIAGVVEQRDSYTAGHERRVADLAVMIGREVGLGEDQLQGLYWAGIVHDIGKIKVPREILCKPGELNATEFALVKLHPEIGYNLLKGISFPWPIADMVAQHHEYIDGSGYPLGLTGDQIRAESKVLTVADIFESISSDRPYHAAENLDEAIRLLTEMRGSKLDERAVDACVQLARRGDFKPHVPEQ
jgi:PAS domain S-box-containing protein